MLIYTVSRKNKEIRIYELQLKWQLFFMKSQLFKKSFTTFIYLSHIINNYFELPILEQYILKNKKKNIVS